MLSLGSAVLFSAIFRARLVHSSPTLSFPINSQVPPVARIGEAFSFVLSDSTFTSSDGSSLTYTLTNSPPWLSFNSKSQELSGTPQEDDVGPGTVVGVNITLLATDSTGSIADEAILVVSRAQAPSVQIPISEQIQTFGQYSEPSSILYPPEGSFEFTFASDTFIDSDATPLEYYSVLIDNSPLPAWLFFDAEALAFSGLTPPFSSLVEPPQTFSVKLIASDVAGFSATSVNFSIVVGSHILTTTQPNITLNATAGEPLVYNGLLGSIEVDGQTTAPGQVNVSTQGLPSWLTFDQASWNISGTPPETAGSTTFTVVMEDRYADVLNITFSVYLRSPDSLFQSTFPTITVKSGETFSFELSSYLLDPSSLDVTASVQPATSWISWDASSLTLSGDAPKSVPQSVVEVNFTVAPESNFKRRRAGVTQSQQLVIQINANAVTTSSSATESSTSSPTSSTRSTATSTVAATAADTDSSNLPTKWTIIAIVISVVAAVAIAALLYCVRRKKQRSKRNSSSTLFTVDLAHPFPDETYVHAPVQPGPLSNLQRIITNSPSHENEKLKPPTTVWKASSLRRELTSSPAPAGFSLSAFYTTTTNDDLPPSIASTPRMRRVKDRFTSIRSLRVVNALRLNRRNSTGSSLEEDEGRSPQVHQGAGFGFDLESAVGGPPVLKLSQGSEMSLRDALEESLNPATQDSSLQITPKAAYSADRRQEEQQQQEQRKQQQKQWRLSRQTSQRQQKGRSVQHRVATPGVLRHRSEAPRRNSRHPEEGDSGADLFTDIYVPGATVSPISPSDTPKDPFNDASYPISPITPTSPPDRPSLPIPSSSVLPTTTNAGKSSQLLRPARSQKSITSTASSSISAQSRKIGRKVSASAKGAIYALQSPKRRTYAALRKHSSSQVIDTSDKKQRVRSTRRKRGPVLEDEESTAANTPNVGGGARSVSSPTASRDRRRSTYQNNAGDAGIGGIVGFPSPRFWPQPASTSAPPAQRNVTMPQSRAERQQRTVIRRRPVPSTSTTAWGASISSVSDLAPVEMPSPLCTPVRGSGGALVSSPFGLGILEPLYAGIAKSSPFGEGDGQEEERNWEQIGEVSEADGDGGDGSPTGRGCRLRAGGTSKDGEVVGQAIGGEEEWGGNARASVAALSEGSKASSGGAAYL